MMKLRDLVKWRNMLVRNVSSDDDKHFERPIFQELTKFNSAINFESLDIKDIKQNMFRTQQVIQENLDSLYNDLNSFIEQLEDMISKLETDYHDKSVEISRLDQDKSFEIKEHHYVNGDLFIDPAKEQFVGTMLKHVNFKWPGMEIGPVTGELTKNIIGLDPLYIADNKAERFDKIKQLWSQKYQDRLRYYVLDDNSDNPLQDLPQNQLKFIVATDWFNFKPQAIIESYVQSAFDILSPGGVMLFTYNNCNYPKAIDKVDKMQYSYTNGKTLKQFCKSVGFEIASSYDGEKEVNWCVSWLEIKKPGERTSLRGGQNLAAINKIWRE